MEATISATGTCNAVTTVQVGSQVSGNVSALYADFNTPVKKGQLVARIDPQTFEARVIQANASLSSVQAAVANAQAMLAKSEADIAATQAGVREAQANVAKANLAVADANAKLKRRIALATQGLASTEDQESAQTVYDSSVAALDATRAQQSAAEDNLQQAIRQREVAQAQVVAAQAQVTQAEASLHQAQIDLDRTSIRAPVDGIVVSRNVDVGQTVAASLQAPTLFLIAQDLTRMQVDTNVDEADVGRVRVGQTARFTVDAYPGRTFAGTVTQIRQAPINIQNVVTYDVLVTVANPQLKLFPGMTANVAIVVDARQHVLEVPSAAFRFRPVDTEGSPRNSRGQQIFGEVVWTLAGKRLHPVPVQTGISDGSSTEVHGDLRPGDQVVVGMAQTGAHGRSAGPAGRPGLRL
jgi:HlyD family secretion protein